MRGLLMDRGIERVRCCPACHGCPANNAVHTSVRTVITRPVLPPLLPEKGGEERSSGAGSVPVSLPSGEQRGCGGGGSNTAHDGHVSLPVDADLRVYIVWLPVMPLDSRFDVADVLADERVTHFWDNEQVVSEGPRDRLRDAR